MAGALHAHHVIEELSVRTLKPEQRQTTPRAGLANIDQLWREYTSTGSPALLNLLIIHYMNGHVRKLAHKLRAQLPPQVEVEDLVDEAYEGLVDAIRRFNPQRDVRFETFASKRLFGAMRDYLRRIDPMPRLARTRSKQAQALIEHYQVRHGRPPEAEELQKLLRLAALKRFRRKFSREPNADELARLNKLADSSFRKTLREGRPAITVSFSGGGADRAGGPPSADRDALASVFDRRLPPVGRYSPLGRAELNDLRRWITQGFSRRDRLIIILYYYEQMTMKEIGLSLGCSESRVSQRLVSILRSLRSRLQRTGGETEFYGK